MLTTCDYSLISEVGNVLSNLPDIDFAAMYLYSLTDNSWKISLRGGDNCEIQLNKIAEKYGGGGHSKACGFTLRDSMYEYFKLKE
jgi:nanoRNase/pAp phosphatase (c-di-AMP/oligoRNAs hydrolase)